MALLVGLVSLWVLASSGEAGCPLFWEAGCPLFFWLNKTAPPATAATQIAIIIIFS